MSEALSGGFGFFARLDGAFENMETICPGHVLPGQAQGIERFGDDVAVRGNGDRFKHKGVVQNSVQFAAPQTAASARDPDAACPAPPAQQDRGV